MAVPPLDRGPTPFSTTCPCLRNGFTSTKPADVPESYSSAGSIGVVVHIARNEGMRARLPAGIVIGGTMSAVMGFTHATSGTAAWLAVTAALPAFGTDILPLTPEGVLAGTLVCAGAALLPDADHPSATIAHSVPVVGPAVTDAINEISGGHRHGAHTLVAAAAVTVGAVFLGRWQAEIPILGHGMLGPAIATVVLIAFAAKARELVPNWLMAWGLGLIAAIAVFIYAPDSTIWFPLAVGLGYLAHIAGDALTTQGIPPLIWPISIKPPTWWRRTEVLNDVWKGNGYIAIPVLGNAGSKREYAVAIVLGAYCCYGITFAVFGLLGIPFVV